MGLIQAHRNSAFLGPSGSLARCTRGHLTLLACVLMLGLLATPSGLSQTRWFKYEGNPVMTAGPSGTWDVSLVHPARVLLEGTIYKMWYTGFDGAGHWQIGYATSRDGIAWSKHKGNPVVQPGPLPWDGGGTAHGYVIRAKAGYRMWYTGGDTGRILQIGYATSTDGVRWRKASGEINPVLQQGPPGSWMSKGLSGSSVMGPDSAGKYKMWFAGEIENHIKIGYATGADTTTWTQLADPVLDAGEPGSWDDLGVCFPRVLFHDNVYEMWYTGFREYPDRRIGHASSRDGIHWNRAPENPVVLPGPKGSWDGGLVIHPEILFDGQFYHMWYAGNNHPTGEVDAWDIGYAISPARTVVSVSPVVVPSGNPVRVRVRMNELLGISLTAEIFSEQGLVAGRISLPDDGRHGDDAADDGCFSNSWLPPGESHYYVDLLLRYQDRGFRLRNAGAFTTVGPITCLEHSLLNDEIPHAGDTLAIKLVLHNQGEAAPAREVEASLLPPSPFAKLITPTPLAYGNIAPDSSAVTPGYYQLVIDPECPTNEDIALNVAISSAGNPYWNDRITLRILPPWWRTGWAFVIYGVVLTASAVSTVRVIGVRKLKRRIAQLERDRALERERMRISQDMHDEVGARLTEIGILGELARKDIGDREKSEADLQKITETSREITASISEIIWAINARNDPLENLVAYLREYASKYLETAAIACKFEIPDAVPDLHLSAEARRNIFLVMKETLNNIVKHSGATGVEIQMSFAARGIDIVVEDNGKGFDTEHPSRFGNGIRNMEKRMSDIGGEFEIWSAPGEGTKTTIRAVIGNRA